MSSVYEDQNIFYFWIEADFKRSLKAMCSGSVISKVDDWKHVTI